MTACVIMVHRLTIVDIYDILDINALVLTVVLPVHHWDCICCGYISGLILNLYNIDAISNTSSKTIFQNLVLQPYDTPDGR